MRDAQPPLLITLGADTLATSAGERDRHTTDVLALAKEMAPHGSEEANSVLALPAVIIRSEERAWRRFLEFFAVHIRNRHTRLAYAHAARSFLEWSEGHGIYDLKAIAPVHVAAYIEGLQAPFSVPTVKQHLAALRALFDWLVVGQIIPTNPAASVKAPRYSVSRGKTPVLDAEEARQLLDSIDTSSPVGLRDRALIALMTYTFARVGAAVRMCVEDFYPQKKRWWVRLQEKNGKVNEMPCHHNLEAYIDEYLTGTNTDRKKGTPLFRSAKGKTGQLTDKPMRQVDVWKMVQRRAKSAGIATHIGCHTFRATGITAYLRNGGKLEVAQRMAGHSNAKTTGLYDRRDDDIS